MENLTRPGQEPQPGDIVRVTRNGAVVERQYHAPAAPPKTPLTRFAFMARFTTAELAGIYSAAAADVGVLVWTKLLEAATTIELDHPQTVAGIAALVDAGLLTQERADVILA